MENQSPRYRVKGISDISETCEVCGRTGLKRVVMIVTLDSDFNEIGDPVAHGTTCAARKMGMWNSQAGGTKAQTEREINEAQNEYRKEARANYFETECIEVPQGSGIVYIDRQYKIGQIMRDKQVDRNEAIRRAREQMKTTHWFI